MTDRDPNPYMEPRRLVIMLPYDRGSPHILAFGPMRTRISKDAATELHRRFGILFTNRGYNNDDPSLDPASAVLPQTLARYNPRGALNAIREGDVIVPTSVDRVVEAAAEALTPLHPLAADYLRRIDGALRASVLALPIVVDAVLSPRGLIERFGRGCNRQVRLTPLGRLALERLEDQDITLDISEGEGLTG